MENKNIGIIGIVLLVIYLVFSILDMNNALSFLPESFSMGEILISMLLVGAGCWLLSNDEHVIFAYADFVIAILFIIFCIGITFIPAETILELAKVIVYIYGTVVFILILNIPLLVRTQSQAHRALKYVTVLFMVLLVILMLTSGGLDSVLTSSILGNSLVDGQSTLIKYGFVVIEGLLLANPMVAVATSDGLGGGRSKTPKLVARNQATDPNMAHQTTIEGGGINYGGMPVPDGVVANNNTDVIPNDNLAQNITQPVETLDAPVAPAPAATPEVAPAPVAEPVTPQPVPTPIAAPAAAPVATPEAAPATSVPTNVINSDDVAASLQALINNNQ